MNHYGNHPVHKLTKDLIKKLERKKRRGFEISTIKFLEENNKVWVYEEDRFGFPMVVNTTYTPDFRVQSRVSEEDIYLEIKGRLTLESRKKYLALKSHYPELDLRFVFQKPNNKIRKGSKTTYWQWAEMHGFKWCGPVIPKEWLDEMSYA